MGRVRERAMAGRVPFSIALTSRGCSTSPRRHAPPSARGPPCATKIATTARGRSAATPRTPPPGFRGRLDRSLPGPRREHRGQERPPHGQRGQRRVRRSQRDRPPLLDAAQWQRRGQDGIVVPLSSDRPTVDCILDPGHLLRLPGRAERRASRRPPPVFRVANVARADLFPDLTARLDFRISGDGFGARHGPRRSCSTSTSTSAADSSHELHRGLRERRLRLVHHAVAGLRPRVHARVGRPPLPVQRPRLHELQLVREDVLLSGGLPERRRTATTGTSTVPPRPTAAAPTWATTRCTGACTPAPPAWTPRAPSNSTPSAPPTPSTSAGTVSPPS